MAGIRRLNHAVLFVSDLERAQQFYEKVLGFRLVMEEPRMNAAFYKTAESDNHHDLGLFGLGAAATHPGRGATGLYHLAWQVDTIEELAEARDDLLGAGALGGESSHGATKSLYGADPDGNQFEIMWMVPRAEWGEYETTAIVELLDLAGDTARWAGIRTADELVRTEE